MTCDKPNLADLRCATVAIMVDVQQRSGPRVQKAISRERPPNAWPGTAEASALQDVHLRLSKGLRKADDQRHPQGDGHAEPQVVHSHDLRFDHCYGFKN